jgi:hypothetical protein
MANNTAISETVTVFRNQKAGDSGNSFSRSLPAAAMDGIMTFFRLFFAVYVNLAPNERVLFVGSKASMAMLAYIRSL